MVITVYSDRSFEFIIKSPPAAVLLKQAAGIPLEKKKGGEVITAEEKTKASGKYKGFKVTRRPGARHRQEEAARPQRPRPRPRHPHHRRHGPQPGPDRRRVNVTHASHEPQRGRDRSLAAAGQLSRIDSTRLASWPRNKPRRRSRRKPPAAARRRRARRRRPKKPRSRKAKEAEGSQGQARRRRRPAAGAPPPPAPAATGRRRRRRPPRRRASSPAMPPRRGKKLRNQLKNHAAEGRQGRPGPAQAGHRPAQAAASAPSSTRRSRSTCRSASTRRRAIR